MKFKVTVKNGVVVHHDPLTYAKWLSKSEGKIMTLDLKTPRETKRYPQLKLVYKIISLIDAETNKCLEETKREVKKHIGYYEVVQSKISGKPVAHYKSFADLSKDEATEVITQLKNLCQFLNIFLPPDNDTGYWDSI